MWSDKLHFFDTLWVLVHTAFCLFRLRLGTAVKKKINFIRLMMFQGIVQKWKFDGSLLIQDVGEFVS